MARILGIDFGLKRSGLSVTDLFQIIVSPLDFVETKDLMDFLLVYTAKESVEKIVIGWPKHKDGNDTYLGKHIEKLEQKLRKELPDIILDRADEDFSSVMAKEILLQSGMPKKKRQEKGNIDKISAVVILQRYLKHI